MPMIFPGMDPWLEDPPLSPNVVHESLIVYYREQLQPLLRPRYVAAIKQRRLYVEEGLIEITSRIFGFESAGRQKSPPVRPRRLRKSTNRWLPSWRPWRSTNRTSKFVIFTAGTT